MSKVSEINFGNAMAGSPTPLTSEIVACASNFEPGRAYCFIVDFFDSEEDSIVDLTLAVRSVKLPSLELGVRVAEPTETADVLKIAFTDYDDKYPAYASRFEDLKRIELRRLSPHGVLIESWEFLKPVLVRLEVSSMLDYGTSGTIEYECCFGFLEGTVERIDCLLHGGPVAFSRLFRQKLVEAGNDR